MDFGALTGAVKRSLILSTTRAARAFTLLAGGSKYQMYPFLVAGRYQWIPQGRIISHASCFHRVRAILIEDIFALNFLVFRTFLDLFFCGKRDGTSVPVLLPLVSANFLIQDLFSCFSCSTRQNQRGGWEKSLR